MIRPMFIVLMFSLLLPFHACTKDASTESTSEAAPTESTSEAAPTESTSEAAPTESTSEEEAPTKKRQ